MVFCGCGDLDPSMSYGAGFIAAAGHCENCDAAQSSQDADKVDAERYRWLCRPDTGPARAWQPNVLSGG